MKKNILTLVVLVVVIGGLFFVLKNKKVDEGGSPIDTSWVTYTNDEYDFSINHPKDWTVEVQTGSEPKINIFPVSQTDPRPYTHHSNVTHVSIFPNGIGTEGVNVDSTTTSVVLLQKTAFGLDMVLGDGTRWATLFTGFINPPIKFNSYGFIWAGVKIQNLEAHCIDIDGSERVLGPEDVCETLDREPERLVYRGTIDEAMRNIEIKMLESFKFID